MSHGYQPALAPFYAPLLARRNIAHTGVAGTHGACMCARHEDGTSRRMFLVPQIQYGRATNSGAVDWSWNPRVGFCTRSNIGSIDPGLPLSHIYRGTDYIAQTPSFVGAADQILFGDRMKITHRLEVMVEGAEPRISWSRQVSARRSTRNPEPLTRYTVACHIAKTVWLCIWSCGGQWPLQDGTLVRYEDLMLLELVQVSAGSHQIVLGYLEPRMQVHHTTTMPILENSSGRPDVFTALLATA